MTHRLSSVNSAQTRLVVLISGSGTNLQALLDAQSRNELTGQIVAVGADSMSAAGLDRAVAADIPIFVVDPRDYEDRAEWDADLAEAIAAHAPDVIVSAGFMRILGTQVLAKWPQQIINTHPSLLPSFPGGNAVEQTIAHGVKLSGCTVHLVDNGVDTGPILAQASVEVLPDDDVPTLHERIKVVERQLLVDTVARFCTAQVIVDGRKARFA